MDFLRFMTVLVLTFSFLGSCSPLALSGELQFVQAVVTHPPNELRQAGCGPVGGGGGGFCPPDGSTPTENSSTSVLSTSSSAVTTSETTSSEATSSEVTSSEVTTSEVTTSEATTSEVTTSSASSEAPSKTLPTSKVTSTSPSSSTATATQSASIVPTDNTRGSTGVSLSGAAIAGIVIGPIIGLIILSFAAWRLSKHWPSPTSDPGKPKKEETDTQESSTSTLLSDNGMQASSGCMEKINPVDLGFPPQYEPISLGEDTGVITPHPQGR